MKKLLFFLAGILISASCNNTKTNENTSTEVDSAEILRNKEAREDSLEMAEALNLQSKIGFAVNADVETTAVESETGDDAADDPAIWINPENPEKSIILGTNKKAGLYAYDLEGNVINYVKAGKVNNVDLRDNFSFAGKNVVLVAGSNRSNNSVSLFYIDKEELKLSDTIANIPSKVDEVYGIAMHYDKDTKDFYVIVNGKGGAFEKWRVAASNDDSKRIIYELSGTFSVNKQPEGIVVDDERKMIYLGVEEEGIFKLSADLKDTSMIQMPQTSDSESFIEYDIEGIALFWYNDKQYLLASIQGSFSYAIYELGETEKYINSFIIKAGHIDGVEETDGLELVVTDKLSGFPGGIMVFQDGFNFDGEEEKTQNFKYVAFDKITELLER